MHHDFRSAPAALLLGVLLAFSPAGCSDSDNPVYDAAPELDALGQAVKPFHDLGAARDAGYDVVVSHPTNHRICLRDSVLGAMGIHFLDGTLVDDTVLVTEPEVLIYEPQDDGSEEFAGVEYIIPFSIRDADQPPPVLFGQEFVQNQTFQLWGLHAWVGRDNPSGMFASWNPDVTCEFVDAVK